MKLYVIPRNDGDGTASIVYTFDKDYIQKALDDTESDYDMYEQYGMVGILDWITVPDNSTAETLNVTISTAYDWRD